MLQTGRMCRHTGNSLRVYFLSELDSVSSEYFIERNICHTGSSRMVYLLTGLPDVFLERESSLGSWLACVPCLCEHWFYRHVFTLELE